MKSVCPFCSNKHHIGWGERRRRCSSCSRTFRVAKAGRKRVRYTEMYLLDRSTISRIGHKTKYSNPEVLRKIMRELKDISTPIQHTKNFTSIFSHSSS